MQKLISKTVREKEFQKSIALIESIKPDIINVTRFSARPGTKAYDMPEKVDGKTMKERSKMLSGLRFKISLEKNQHYLGSEQKVLMTEPGKPGGTMGRTMSYRPVVFEKEFSLGQFYDVNIIDAKEVYLVGKVIE